MRRFLAGLKVAAVLCGVQASTSSIAHDVSGDKLGNVNFPISCKTEQAKFDRAVALLHNFFYPETSKAFQAIIQTDPDCGIAYWGLAASLRPNPLVPPFPQNLLKAGWDAVQKGKAAKEQTPKESAYLAAIELFYKDYDSVDQRIRSRAYSDAMSNLHQKYPDDPEAAIFYALALLETIDFSDKTYGNQLKAAAILNDQNKTHPEHPGIAHYLIHAYDFAPLAAMCVSTAHLNDKIAANSPHALHMPSHIYSMLAMWDDSIKSNLASVSLANAYAAKAYPDSTDAQVPHDLDFLMYAYLQQGRDNEAKDVMARAADIKKMAVVRLTVDTALAAIPARYVIERGAWKDAVYAENCAACHGDNAKQPATGFDRLSGGKGTLATPKPVQTIGSYWPYATTVFDYVNRAMPFTSPQSLSHDDVYAIVAYLLYANDIVPKETTLDAVSLAKVKMPNADGFIPDGRPDTDDAMCKADCK